MMQFEAKPGRWFNRIDKIVIAPIGDGSVMSYEVDPNGEFGGPQRYESDSVARVELGAMYRIPADQWLERPGEPAWHKELVEAVDATINTYASAVLPSSADEPLDPDLEHFRLSINTPDGISIHETEMGRNWEFRRGVDAVGGVTILHSRAPRRLLPHHIEDIPTSRGMAVATTPFQNGVIEFKCGRGVQRSVEHKNPKKPDMHFTDWQLFLKIDNVDVLVFFATEVEIDRNAWLPAIESMSIRRRSDDEMSAHFDAQQQQLEELRDVIRRPTAAKQYTCEILESPQETQLEVYPDRLPFHLWDAEIDPGAFIDWSSDDTGRDLAQVEPYCVSVFTVCRYEASVTIEIRPDAPPENFSDWDHVVECSLELPSGRLELDAWEPIAEWKIPPGYYRVRICCRGLDSVDEDGEEGDDIYRIIFWPGDARPLKVLKRWTRP